MIIGGFTIRPEEPAACHLVWRFYGTRGGFRYPDERVRPQPGTWDLVREVRCSLLRGRLTLPDFELEPTRPGGWRFEVGRQRRTPCVTLTLPVAAA